MTQPAQQGQGQGLGSGSGLGLGGLGLQQVSVTVVAKYAYTATDATKLTLRKGDVIMVHQQAPSGWWHGISGTKRGWFPSNFVTVAGTPLSSNANNNQTFRTSNANLNTNLDGSVDIEITDVTEDDNNIANTTPTSTSDPMTNSANLTSPSAAQVPTGSASMQSPSIGLLDTQMDSANYTHSNTNPTTPISPSPYYDLQSHFYCETDDGRRYFVNKNTGETYWDGDTPPSNSNSGSVQSSALPYSSPSNANTAIPTIPTSANPTTTIKLHDPTDETGSISSSFVRSSSNYSALVGANNKNMTNNYSGNNNVETASINSTILPPGWTKIENPDGQTMYYNAISNEMQFTPPDESDFANAYAHAPRKPGDDVTAVAVVDLPRNWNRKTTADGKVFFYNFITDQTVFKVEDVDPETGESIAIAVDVVDEIEIPLSNLVKLTYAPEYIHWRQFAEDFAKITKEISIVSKDQNKIKVFRYWAVGSEKIQIFLLAAQKADGPSESRIVVRSSYTKIMHILSQVDIAVSIACMVWSPPDSMQSLQHAFAILIPAVTELVVGALETKLIITDDDKAQATKASEKFRKDGLSSIELLLELKQRCANVTNMCAEVVKDILENPLSQRKLDPLDTISIITAMMGEVSATVDEFSPELGILPHATAELLRQKKQTFFNYLSQLMSAVSAASNPFAPANAAIEVATSAKDAYAASTELIIFFKFSIQEKEAIEDPSLINDSSSSVYSGRTAGRLAESANESVGGTSLLQTTTSGNGLVLPVRQSSLANRGIFKKSKPISGGGDLDSEISDFEESASLNTANNSSPRISAASPISPMSPQAASGILRLNIPKPQRDAITIGGTGGGRRKAGGNAEPSVVTMKVEKPWYMRYSFAPNEISLSSDGHVKGGTLAALVEKLTAHDTSDATFTQSFLLTYRAFTTTKELFMLLQQRYMLVAPPELNETELADWTKDKKDIIRVRVFNVMKHWVESYCYDDEEDLEVLQIMKNFADTLMMEETPNTAFQLSNLVDRRREYGANLRVRTAQYNNKEFPASIKPWNLKSIVFLELNPLEAARQLTLMESSMYNKIQPVECLKKAWSAKQNNQSPHIKGMIRMSNQIAAWTVTTILSEPDVKRRGELIKQFVAIAEKCRTLNNYCTLNTILGALNSASVHRLKKSWQLIGKRILVFKELCELMSLEKNFARYRETLKSSNPPCIPYFGLFLTDLTFIEDGSADILKPREHLTFPDQLFSLDLPPATHVEGAEAEARAGAAANQPVKLINFFKHVKTAEIIRDIQQFQNEPYHIAPITEVQDFFYKSFEVDFDDKQLYSMSLALEPRERGDNVEVARALFDAGFVAKNSK
ncbi:hypothetical protein HK100_002477 [Physocladia obscura]|uniref:Uncharacterized protein n=1 Tax=Physocladia obscura TaxID=109957 RepID=A0AAD5TD33_9FUNG|nr:hypothetical protein HK100_002477 [Physocladia obscura]